MNKDIISIIVPIYNVENYIEECIKSILYQTYEKLEIILVDDGSTDKCGEIIDIYEKRDKRIKVIHKENGGLSDARNVGLDFASGEYVCFIDSDDFVEADYIQELYQAIKTNDADISICGYRNIYDKGKIKNEKIKRAVLTNREVLQILFTKAGNNETVTWNKMYKLKLFLENKVKFPKGKLHEDNFTTYKLLYYCNKVVYIDKILYNYRQRTTSIVGSYNPKKLAILDVIEEIKTFFKNKDIKLNQEIEAYELLIYLGVINMLINVDKNAELIYSQLVQKVKNNKSIYAKNKIIGKKQKICLNILTLNNNLYIMLRKVHKLLV